MDLKESILLVDYINHELNSKDNPLFIPIITLFLPIRKAPLHYFIRPDGKLPPWGEIKA